MPIPLHPVEEKLYEKFTEKNSLVSFVAKNTHLSEERLEVGKKMLLLSEKVG